MGEILDRRALPAIFFIRCPEIRLVPPSYGRRRSTTVRAPERLPPHLSPWRQLSRSPLPGDIAYDHVKAGLSLERTRKQRTARPNSCLGSYRLAPISFFGVPRRDSRSWRSWFSKSLSTRLRCPTSLKL